jgi:hypothetical protein
MKTKKEASLEYVGCNKGDNPIPDEAREAIRAFEAGIKFQRNGYPLNGNYPKKRKQSL